MQGCGLPSMMLKRWNLTFSSLTIHKAKTNQPPIRNTSATAPKQNSISAVFGSQEHDKEASWLSTPLPSNSSKRTMRKTRLRVCVRRSTASLTALVPRPDFLTALQEKVTLSCSTACTETTATVHSTQNRCGTLRPEVTHEKPIK